VHSLVSVVIAMFLIGLAVMIAVPALIIGACVVGLFFLAIGVRSLILRFKEGPKADTMRENVRVVVRQEP
jgi:O-antigen/teichoic acid export membrane protein